MATMSASSTATRKRGDAAPPPPAPAASSSKSKKKVKAKPVLPPIVFPPPTKQGYHLVCDRSGLEEPHRIFYKLYGNPTAPHRMIFTMGLGGTADQFFPQVAHFVQFPDEFQFVTYDNRGMGFSDPVSGRWTTTHMARDTLSLLASLGWTQNVHVIGLSMGGMISQELIRQGAPGQFASLSLLSTIAGGPFSLYLFIGSIPTGLQLAARTFLTTDPNTQLKNGLALLYPTPFLEADAPGAFDSEGKPLKNFVVFRRALVARGIQNQKEGMPSQRFSSIFKQGIAVFSHNVTPDELREISKKVQGNVVVVTGDMDILVHPRNSDRLAEGLKGDLVMVPGSGHGANEQCADVVNAAIERNVRKAGQLYAPTSRL